MLKQHARTVDVGVRLYDLIALTISMPLAHAAYVASEPSAVPPGIADLWLPLVFVLLSWAATAWAFEVYGGYRTRSPLAEVARIAKALATSALVLAAAAFFLKHPMSRLLTGLYFLSALALVAGTRLVLRFLARAFRRRGYNTRRYAIVGMGELAEAIARTFASHPQWGFQLAGYVLPVQRLDVQVPAPPGTVLGTLGDLENILDEHVLDEVVFAVPRVDLPGVEKAILLCEEQGVAVVMSLEPFRIGKADLSLFELSDRPMLVLSRTPSNSLSLIAKRAFDVFVSAAVLFVLSPAFLAIAVAIKLESPGPVFFRQRRVGRNGRSFMMLKFRSMFRDAEERLAALRAHNEMSGPVFKMANDPRVTRVGKFLRKTSLDELPQFWNVLMGDMSVVGPRPPIPAEVKQYKRWQRRRLSVKPGITCTWQVSGRNNIDFDRWMELDLEYIDNWSLWRDMEICLKTVPAVLTSRGAR
jgi:exopolysaccharide biosynthesis polyprenyl glycosylphosphotransferase